MQITKFINFINKRTKRQIDASYYTYIDLWRQFWKGYVPAFHTFNEVGLDGAKHKRQLYSMRMPKKACEDWASLLINDKTAISLSDEKTAQWLLGKEQSGGVLKQMNFWTNANALVEKAFWSGTGAFVLNIENMLTDGKNVLVSPEAEINMDYLDASCIIPLTVKHGRIVDVAFATSVFIQGRPYIYLQTHILKKDGYSIRNEFFTCEDEKQQEPAYRQAYVPGIAAEFNTKSRIPLFAIFSPAIVKNIDGGTGLGMSVFAEAMDPAKQVDIAFNNYHRDIFLGGKKVFYNKKLVREYIGHDGKPVQVAPDDVQQQLFYQSDDGAGLNDGKQDVYEYNPSLRTEENARAVQDALNYFSFKVGFGTHHYQFDRGNITTATQYNGDRQDMVQNANKHRTQVEAALIDIIRAVLWAGKNILGADIDDGTNISICWDDSYITDATTRRLTDREDANNGFIPKWMYNKVWRGMSEEEAKAAVLQAADEIRDYQLQFGDE